jgi:hypothetical protein
MNFFKFGLPILAALWTGGGALISFTVKQIWPGNRAPWYVRAVYIVGSIALVAASIVPIIPQIRELVTGPVNEFPPPPASLVSEPERVWPGVDKNSVADLRAFASRFTTDFRASAALSRIDELIGREWVLTDKTNAAALDEFIRKYPQHPLASSAETAKQVPKSPNITGNSAVIPRPFPEAVQPPTPPAPPPDVLGTMWTVTEIEGWYGTWTRRGRTHSFDATYYKRGGGAAPQEAMLELTLDGSQIEGTRVQKRGSDSAGRACRYRGQLSRDGRRAQGTYQCQWVPGQTFNWSATIQ